MQHWGDWPCMNRHRARTKEHTQGLFKGVLFSYSICMTLRFWCVINFWMISLVYCWIYFLVASDLIRVNFIDKYWFEWQMDVFYMSLWCQIQMLSKYLMMQNSTVCLREPTWCLSTVWRNTVSSKFWLITLTIIEDGPGLDSVTARKKEDGCGLMGLQLTLSFWV